jgi:hypothetical protein
MDLREKLQAEADARAAHLATRFAPNRCIACGSTKAAELIPTDFKWRKQVGRGEHHHERVTHTSTHPLCAACMAELRRLRRRFWPLRYAGGIALTLRAARRFSVPGSLFDMTGNGWECIGVTNQAA